MGIDLAQINSCRERIRELAASMLAGETTYIEGSREMCSLFPDANVDHWSKPFVTIVAVESETDGFPLGRQRAMWGDAVLKKKDEEREKAEPWARQVAEEACREMLTAPELDPLDFP